MVENSENIKLLILEDDEIDQMTLERYFKAQKLNYDYTIVDSLSKAKELLENNTFNIILSDNELVDGFGTELLSHGLNIPLILVTGAGDQNLAADAMKKGAFDYIVKDLQRNYLHFIPVTIQKALFHSSQDRKFKRMQSRLEKLNWLISKADTSVVIFNVKGEIIWLNDGFEKLTGIPFSALKKTKKIKIWDSGFSSLDLESEIFKHTLTGETFNFESTAINEKGELSYLYSTISPQFNDYSGEIDEIVLVSIDVSEKKKAEAEVFKISNKLKILVDNLLVGVVFIDISGKIAHSNAVFQNLFDLKLSNDRKKTTHYWDVHEKIKEHFSDEKQFDDETRALFDGKAPQVREELKLKNGKVLNRSYVPIISKGKFLGELIIYQDITIRFKIQEDLIKSKQTAEGLSKVKEEFLANMSHEIRTPMNAILGMAQILEESELEPDAFEQVKSIKYAAENLLVILNDILDISKIEAGRLDLELIPISFHDIVTHLIQTISNQANKKGIVVEVDIADDIPKKLKGDPVRLRQIFLNLLSNSIKFTSEGTVKLSVNLAKRFAKKVELEFIVEDTGIGISQDRLPFIFDLFTQAAVETTRKFGGTGLGLSIVRRLVKLMDGKIQVESALDKGSKFILNIPFEIIKEKKSLGASTNGAVGKKENSAFNILVVEDNELNQKVASMYLSRLGHKIDIAENGEIALEKLNQGNFDIVLMDLQMPVMDGYETTRQIRKTSNFKFNHIPIIAMTAHAIKGELEKCVAIGMDDYVSKPIDFKELISKIQKVMD